MGSNLAGVSFFSNLTLTRLSAPIVRNPRFERFFAWQRLDCCWRSGVSFFMGSKGDVKHSVCVFFAWHGLEPCWCFGLFESDADETLTSHRSESTFRTVFCMAEARLLLAFGCFVFYGWREAFCLRVFCLAWARILLVFRSFRIWRWRDFDQPSFGIHVSNGFLLGRGSTAAGVRVFRNRSFVCFLWIPKVTWSILSACFLLGMGSNLAGVSVFSNLTLTRLSAAIVRNPRSCLCVSNVLVRHPFWCTNRVLRALILLVFRSFRIYSWQKFDSHRQESTLVFICIYLYYIYREFGPPSLTTHASACRSAALLVQKSRLRALILLLFRSFRIWGWRQFEQPSSAIHACVRFWLVWARVEVVFGCLHGWVSSFFRASESDARHFFWCQNSVLGALILLVFRSFRIWSWRGFTHWLSRPVHLGPPSCRLPARYFTVQRVMGHGLPRI